MENCACSLCFRPKPDAPTIVDNIQKIPRIENVGAATRGKRRLNAPLSIRAVTRLVSVRDSI